MTNWSNRYWASSFEPENFSFVQHALTDGYSIFYYDRLGVGLSSRVSGYEIQIAPQVEILACLVKSIRAGQYTDTIKANKIAAIGHSFGSSVSNTLVQKYPKIVDAVVLTGFALANFSDPAAGGATVIPTVFAGRLLPTLQSSSVPQYSDTFDSGYLGFVDQYAFAEAFTHHAVTEQEMKAAQYSFSINQPHSIPELLSLLTVGGDSTDFEGKVVLTAGEFDLVVCAGDCISTFRDGLQDTIYHRTSVTKIIQKGAGHGQNFEPNNVFEEILQGIKGL
jgi:pimeloyl-ACP methyl ester carboxylesterase